ncbi:hypothetical protein BDV96DRAFT_141450 [Lophiotrema nucula]|uniref:Uncharacterized protein n=1 Tax=Lophiotrema nucula TaxID=690887 RepID=A0A6A5ZTT3_9PLEO|nr:hypothetical protein BDV96DRAFT_141450 [Lophiotrema nucula]
MLLLEVSQDIRGLASAVSFATSIAAEKYRRGAQLLPASHLICPFIYPLLIVPLLIPFSNTSASARTDHDGTTEHSAQATSCPSSPGLGASQCRMIAEPCCLQRRVTPGPTTRESAGEKLGLDVAQRRSNEMCWFLLEYPIEAYSRRSLKAG